MSVTTTPTTNIYESTFAQSDKTDAILIVDGHKLHVNKAFLSYHSDYFQALFNSDFKEKSMEEIPIQDVKFEDFATLLSLVLKNPILPEKSNYKKLLKLADQFQLPAAKRHLELFIASIEIDKMEKLELADQYELNALRDHALEFFNQREHYKEMMEAGKKFSAETKARIFDDFFTNFGESL